jgi:ketosteroid isomerase-like protein
MATNKLTLEERVRRLEDIQEIANLKADYLTGADGGWAFNPTSSDAEVVAPLFAEKGSWYSDSQGLVTGPEAIRKVWRSFSATMPFAYHVITNPKIVVTGDHGTGEWHLMMKGIDAKGTEIWASGLYNDEFVRTAEGWRIKRVQAKIVFLGPYGRGWKSLMEADPRNTGGSGRAPQWPVMRDEKTKDIR